MKKCMLFIMLFACMLGLVAYEQHQTLGGSKSSMGSTSLASFSFEEDCSIYIEGNPDVKTDDFLNVDAYPIDDQVAAVKRAKNECTIEYNATSEYYDRLTDTWRIDFFTLNRNGQGQLVATPGDCQSVYLNSDGITQLVVCGE
jgi:hypothetical protein